VQFAARAGYIGGDTVANALIREALTEGGYRVQTLSAEPVGKRDLIRSWIWGEKWHVHRNIAAGLKGRHPIVIIDAQLNIGMLRQRCINIFHFSFRGYRKLAGVNWSLGDKLSNVIDSLLQAIGSLGAYNVAVSDFQRRFLRTEGVKVHRVVGNSVDLDTFAPRRPSLPTAEFLFVGGYSHYGKGFDVLERLAQRGLAIDCASNIRPRAPLRYLGSIPHEGIPGVLSSHLILLHPSRYESCSMSVLEALACGIPVLISKVGIGAELRKEIPEFVVEGFDDRAIDEYLEKARVILGDYERFSRLARAYVEKRHSYGQFKANWKDLVDRSARL